MELKHMDVCSRNQRLRETLEGMGLFVLPIFCESDPRQSDYLHVSAVAPSYARQDIGQRSTSGSVVRR